jgi:pSer/pThr/pTyr-binding forkhead associated (FHA) protein
VQNDGLDIGRADENHVVLNDDPAVSRFHARLLYDNGSLWLRDAGSRNGIFVNDKRLGDHRDLRVGDTIRIGQSVFEVRWQGDKDDDRAGSGNESSAKRRFWPFG